MQAQDNTCCTLSVMLEPVRLTEHLRDSRKSESKKNFSSFFRLNLKLLQQMGVPNVVLYAAPL